MNSRRDMKVLVALVAASGDIFAILQSIEIDKLHTSAQALEVEFRCIP